MLVNKLVGWLVAFGLCGMVAACSEEAVAHIEISDAYARPTLAGQTQGGAFLTIKNSGTQKTTLVSAQVEPNIAKSVELHQHIHENGMMKMREIKGGIPLSAGETVQLKPGGLHIMFFDLQQPLTQGKVFPMTLQFSNSPSQTVQVKVRKMDDTPH